MARVRITFEVPDGLLDAVVREVQNHIWLHAECMAPATEFIVFRAGEYTPVDVEKLEPSDGGR